MIQEHAQEAVNVGEIVLHHTADASEIEFDFIVKTFTVHLPHWNDIHIGSLTLNLSPTKHVVFMILAAFLVFISMWVTGRKLKEQRADKNAPTGFANAMEARFSGWILASSRCNPSSSKACWMTCEMPSFI